MRAVSGNVAGFGADYVAASECVPIPNQVSTRDYAPGLAEDSGLLEAPGPRPHPLNS